MLSRKAAAIKSEIESLASRTSSAALQLRFAQDDIDQIGNERGRRGYRQIIEIALADAAGCSGREFNYLRNSPADRTKSAAG